MSLMNVHVKPKETLQELLRPRKIKSKLAGRKQSVPQPQQQYAAMPYQYPLNQPVLTHMPSSQQSIQSNGAANQPAHLLQRKIIHRGGETSAKLSSLIQSTAVIKASKTPTRNSDQTLMEGGRFQGFHQSFNTPQTSQTMLHLNSSFQPQQLQSQYAPSSQPVFTNPLQRSQFFQYQQSLMQQRQQIEPQKPILMKQSSSKNSKQVNQTQVQGLQQQQQQQNYGNLILGYSNMQGTNNVSYQRSNLQYIQMKLAAQQQQKTSISPMKDQSLTQKRRGGERQASKESERNNILVNLAKELKLQQMRNEARKNDVQLQQNQNHQILQVMKERNQALEASLSDVVLTSIDPPDYPIPSINQYSSHSICPNLQSTPNGNFNIITGKGKQGYKRVQNAIDSKSVMNRKEPIPDHMYRSPSFTVEQVQDSSNMILDFNSDHEEVDSTKKNEKRSGLTYHNTQGKQGECQPLPEQKKKVSQSPTYSQNVDAQKSNQRSNKFSFGQISPKFYQDQPAANLLEQEDKQPAIAKRKPKQKPQTAMIEDSEAQVVHANRKKDQPSSEALKQQVRQSQPANQMSSQIKEFMTAGELYGGNEQASSRVQHTYNSIGSDLKPNETSNGLDSAQSIGPKNLRKIRVDSFAKTPFFLKSPRSIASSHYGQDVQDHDFGTLKTYNEEVDEISSKRLKMRQRNKVSQSSDEIAKVVNVFFEKNNTILEVVPLPQNRSFVLGQLNKYSPMRDQSQKAPHGQLQKNPGITQTQQPLLLGDIENTLYSQNNNYIQIPAPKYFKPETHHQVQRDTTKGRQKNLKQSKYLIVNAYPEQIGNTENGSVKQTSRFAQASSSLRSSQQQVSPQTCEDRTKQQEYPQGLAYKSKGESTLQKKNKQLFFNHQY